MSKKAKGEVQVKVDPYKKISIYARERMCKDFPLPIELFQSPYFEYFVELYDSVLGVKRKIRMFQDAVAICGSEAKFWTHLNVYFVLLLSSQEVKSQLSSCIKEDPSFKALSQKETQAQYAIHNKNLPSQKTLYVEENHGKVFISLDLVTANFNSLRYHNSKYRSSFSSLILIE